MFDNEAWVRIKWIWAASQICVKPVLIKRRLESWKTDYNFEWNQPYLSPGLNFSRSSNSLNSAYGWFDPFKIVSFH